MLENSINSAVPVAEVAKRAGGQDVFLSPWIMVPVVFGFWVFFLSIAKRIVFALFKRLSGRTKTKLDDVLFEALDFPLQLMIYATGVLVVQNFIPKGGADISGYLVTGFKVVGIVAMILFVDRFLRSLVTVYQGKVEIFRASAGTVQGVVRILVLLLGGLVLLDSLGVSITPIIASLGIGSLAVALALQPTLENFFSGVQLVADKPVQIGQFIKLETGEEGTVTKIGWRSTWILQPNNNTVVIPNKVLVDSRILNYYYPNTEMAVLVGVGVHYDSDLDKVERVTVEVARTVMQQSQGGVPSFEPFIRYHTFADFSINFNVIMRAKDWPSTHLVKHEFIKQLQVRYASEGIIIPYPIRTMVQAG